MLQKAITYTDWNDEERTETFYFNLTKTELSKLEYAHSGGLTEWIKRAVEAKDGKTILDTFEEIIRATYGVKSPDGRTFIKSQQAFEEFKGTAAYDQLYMELVTDGEKAAKFITDCMPKELRAEAEKHMKENKADATVIKKVES